jgi:hypothetical protein
MVSNPVQPSLKPSRSWPSPANLWQLFAVVKSLIHRALAEDGFPSIHDYSLLDINSTLVSQERMAQERFGYQTLASRQYLHFVEV